MPALPADPDADRNVSPARQRQASPLWYQTKFLGVRSSEVEFNGPEDFFEKTMLAYVEKTWEQWLGPLVPSLPSFQTVICVPSCQLSLSGRRDFRVTLSCQIDTGDSQACEE